MITTAIVTFRESLEALVIISILLGFSRKFKLKQELFIMLGALSGFIFSGILIVFSFIYFFKVRTLLPEEGLEMIEHIISIASGFLLIFITAVLHPLFSQHKNNHLESFLIKKHTGGIPFLLTAFGLATLEGIEIILFTTSSSFTSSFANNVIGLLIGLTGALLASIIIYFTYLRIHLHKLFKITEYILIIFGIFLISKGGWELILTYFNH